MIPSPFLIPLPEMWVGVASGLGGGQLPDEVLGNRHQHGCMVEADGIRPGWWGGAGGGTLHSTLWVPTGPLCPQDQTSCGSRVPSPSLALVLISGAEVSSSLHLLPCPLPSPPPNAEVCTLQFTAYLTPFLNLPFPSPVASI